MDDFETTPVDWDSPDWGNHVHVASNGSWIGGEAA